MSELLPGDVDALIVLHHRHDLLRADTLETLVRLFPPHTRVRVKLDDASWAEGVVKGGDDDGHLVVDFPNCAEHPVYALDGAVERL